MNKSYRFDIDFDSNNHNRWIEDNMIQGNMTRNGVRQEELIDFKSILSLLKRKKWIILLSVLLTVSASYYLAYEYLMPVYSSSSTIELDFGQDNFPGGRDNISSIIIASFEEGNSRSLQNEIYNFQSSEVVEVVAEHIMEIKHQPDGDLYPVLWTAFPVDSTLAHPTTVASRIRNMIQLEQVERSSNFLRVSIQSHSPYEAARLTNLVVNRYLEWTNQKKRSSASSAKEFIENERERVEADLNRAENRLGTFMNERELIELEAQASSGVNALANLEAEKKSMEIELESVNSAIESYETRMESIRPGLARQYSEAVGPTIARYQQELAELTTRRFVILSNNPSLRENQDSEPELRRLNNQIRELQDEIEDLSNEMINRNEQYLGFSGGGDGNLTTELSNIQNMLMQQRIQKNQLESQLNALDQRISNTRLFLDRVPENRIQLARLEREVNAYENLFTTLSNQAAEISLWEQTMGRVGTIINSASVPTDPIKPEKELMLAVGFMVGFLLPVGFFYVRENFSSTIQSIKEMEKFSYPILSVIYDYKRANQIENKQYSAKKSKNISDHGKNGTPENLVVVNNSASPLAESYRRLANNILYSYPSEGSKIYLVTSSEKGEGKTTTASNLAAAFTELNKKVLIIDCDLRRPGLSKFFGVPKSPGILEMIFDKQDAASVVKPTKVEKLFLLTSGNEAPNPPSVLGSPQMRDIIQKSKNHFDIVLLDTAPYGIVTDVAPVIELTDGIILVTKFKQTKKSTLSNTISQLEKSRVRIVGTVLNHYDPKKSTDSIEVNAHYEALYKNYYEYTGESV